VVRFLFSSLLSVPRFGCTLSREEAICIRTFCCLIKTQQRRAQQHSIVMMNVIQNQPSPLNASPHHILNNMDPNDVSLPGVNASIPFPWKLHEMLAAADMEASATIVSWLPDESSFKVHNPEAFVKDIMPRYFNQTKYKSFQRQLNMWGFERILGGPAKGGYSHSSLVRGQPMLCRNMKRMKIKGTGVKRSQSPVVPTQIKSLPIAPLSSIIPEVKSLQEKPPHKVSEELFDEDTLFSVLSSAMGNSFVENTPQNGDTVLFEGKQFFFIEDYHQPENEANSKPPRRFSLEFSSSAGRPSQRCSPETSPQVQFQIPSTPSRTCSRQISLELAAQFQPSEYTNPGNQSRRFSIERSSQDLNFVLRQMVEL
jgi:hypothetical protein